MVDANTIKEIIFYNTDNVSAEDLRGIFSKISGKQILVIYRKLSDVASRNDLAVILYNMDLICDGKQPKKGKAVTKGSYKDL